MWDEYTFGTNLDFQNHQNAQNRKWDDYTFGTNMDWNQYADAANRAWQEKEFEYQQGRDAKSDYDAAFNRALSLAQSGMGIPANYGSQLEPETLDRLNALAAQVQAQQALAAAGGSGGGGGSRGSRSGKSGKSGGNGGYENYTVTNWNDDSQVAVPGFGRMTWEELKKHVKDDGSGDIEQIYNADKNTITYRKKR